ncbi:hypothetical protein K1719_017521 [Acacia pycnantha]|nr:hypothetical protein K1719_017521 [Acacia pycnantha]
MVSVRYLVFESTCKVLQPPKGCMGHFSIFCPSSAKLKGVIVSKSSLTPPFCLLLCATIISSSSFCIQVDLKCEVDNLVVPLEFFVFCCEASVC